ncbi:FAD binding domain-containing protein [Cupriavidus pinatubonensis]|uniref:Aldehyde oxidoreductase FAD-binding subunit PaoB n=1 Tax=Cupriavidus pinatubonensis TaxID=248026 RepID=A0ABM8Y476_9BURK|nr:xanthine dehydrogenase family protein subunit M [Cupriavidus pinatubonensis]CAG9187593.1 Aldehyde oxidoreductase FAD-binding subunit PaoB [Cupriavidus pinatubonensis]
MKSFFYARATDLQSALQLLSERPNAKLLGGGTNLIDLMRENIEQPDALVDVSGLPLDRIEASADGGLVIGAAVKNTALALSPLVRERYPMLAQAVLFGASGQIRNMATVAGNIMQRTRCLYFYDRTASCNKRAPGTGCDAIGGFNRMHAILGASDSCVATHPSDMCVALAALGAVVNIVGPNGERSVPLTEFHRLPGDSPQFETVLAPNELITGVAISPIAFARHSLYRKVRDRASYAFALVSVAAAMEVREGKVCYVRLALGGVAHKPWRAFEAERALTGAPADRRVFLAAADAELAVAKGLTYNSFKIELARRVIVGAFVELANRS